jgi:hypothetical protein
MGMGSGVGGSGKGGGAAQATSNGKPVYWDAEKGKYYTTSGSSGGYSGVDPRGPGYGGLGIFGQLAGGGERTYLGNSLNTNDFEQSTATPNVYNTSYPQPTGEAFNNGVNSDSGIASILAGLYSSGVFNQQTTNPYAPQGTTGSFTGIPYGQQQESMFSHPNTSPYGGSQGQGWNPYGNYYTASNTSAGGGTNSNGVPPPRTTGPDALQQLSFMMQNNQNQNTQI